MRGNLSLPKSSSQRAVNRLVNGLDERKARKPERATEKHVPVCCGEKKGQRRVVLAPVAALGIAGFPGLYV